MKQYWELFDLMRQQRHRERYIIPSLFPSTRSLEVSKNLLTFDQGFLKTSRKSLTSLPLSSLFSDITQAEVSYWLPPPSLTLPSAPSLVVSFLPLCLLSTVTHKCKGGDLENKPWAPQLPPCPLCPHAGTSDNSSLKRAPVSQRSK